MELTEEQQAILDGSKGEYLAKCIRWLKGSLWPGSVIPQSRSSSTRAGSDHRAAHRGRILTLDVDT